MTRCRGKPEGVMDGVWEEDIDCDEETDCDALNDGVSVADTLCDAERDVDAVMLDVAEGVWLEVGVPLGEQTVLMPERSTPP
jgi:hypothetical protein